MKEYIKEIENYLIKKGIAYKSKTIELLKQYIDAVYDKNKVMNLTAAKCREEIARRHCLDSLSICDVTTFKEGECVLDLGTGAGFPGVPLAIIFSNTQFILMDSVKKKLDFIQQTCHKLGIQNVQVYHGRIEEFGNDCKFRERFDYVCARALAPLPILLEYSIPFLKLNGQLICYKGKNVDQEIKQAQRAFTLLKAQMQRKEMVKLKTEDRINYFIVVNKNQSTPNIYPRKVGIPKKEPL